MKFTILIGALFGVVAAGCVDELDEETDEVDEVTSAIWTDVDRNNLRYPLRIKSMINTSGAGRCMDVAGGYTATGTPIVQYPCHSGTAQKFFLFTTDFGSSFQIRSRINTNQCVGVGANNQLALTPCEVLFRGRLGSAAATKFYLEGTDLRHPDRSHARIRSVAVTNTCIDVPGGSSWHSLILQTYSCHNGPNQQWEISNLGM